MKKYSILIVSVLLLAASCNKKPTPTLGMADKMRSGRWTVASGTITLRLPNGLDTTINYMKFIPQCHLDDYIIFKAGNDGTIFSGSNKCNPADPDSATIKWFLTNNDNTLNMSGGYVFTFAVRDSIMPFVFDTLSQAPLVLDTIHGVNDTTFGYTRAIIVLDTIWQLRFDTTGAGLKTNDIYNASITNFSQSQFTINYWIYSHYLDSTNHHTNQFIYPDPVSGANDTLDYNPIMRNDTFKYSVTYKNG